MANGYSFSVPGHNQEFNLGVLCIYTPGQDLGTEQRFQVQIILICNPDNSVKVAGGKQVIVPIIFCGQDKVPQLHSECLDQKFKHQKIFIISVLQILQSMELKKVTQV